MKVYREALSPKLVQSCIDELNDKIKTGGWQSSQQVWPDDVMVNVTGSTLIAEPSADLVKRLEKELKSKLPASDKIGYRFHVWQKNSGLSLHTDADHKWAATLYLNKTWYANYGGIFLWFTLGGKKLNAEMPEFNMLVVNDAHEAHMVTTLGANILPEDRYTIQIFGD